MEHKLFRSKFQLWDHLQHECDGLDIHETLHLPLLWFADKDGDIYKNGSVKDFANSVNTRFGTSICDHHSYRQRKMVVLFFKETMDEEEVITEVVVDTTPLISLDAEESVEMVEDIVEDVVAVEKEITPDWDWIESLESNKEDKLALDNYAADKFGIELKRNMTLPNMIKAFKAALNK